MRHRSREPKSQKEKRKQRTGENHEVSQTITQHSATMENLISDNGTKEERKYGGWDIQLDKFRHSTKGTSDPQHQNRYMKRGG